jgi:hypothetical protein
MLTVACWRWGSLFGPEYVNRLKAMLGRHLHLPHELTCITDDATGIDGDVRIVPLPESLRDTPRCRRRMRIFDGAFAKSIGKRILCIDLDVVIVNGITPILNRPEPLVCWKVQHAGVYSGSFLLMDAGVLHGLWEGFSSDPDGYPSRVSPEVMPSDQAMLNAYLRGSDVPCWTERDGFVTYFGEGYAHKEHLGVGPKRQELPQGARIVVLGSADKRVMDEGRYDWVAQHWRAA